MLSVVGRQTALVRARGSEIRCGGSFVIASSRNADRGEHCCSGEPLPSTAGNPCQSLRLKHIGGYFDPRASTQLRHLAVTENRSVQALLAEAIDLLFQARGLAPLDE